MIDEPSYAIPVHASLSEPVTLGGVPRSVAIINATCGAVLCFGLQAPWIGVPLCAVVHAVSYWIASKDPYAFQAIRRHLAYPSYLDG